MDGWMDGGYYFKDIILTPLTNCYFNIATFNIATFTWDGVRGDKIQSIISAAKLQRVKLFMELHYCPKSISTKNNLKVWKSGFLAQSLKFFLSSLLAFKVRQHANVETRDILRSHTWYCSFWHE